MTIHAYIRVSTTSQTIDKQRSILNDYAQSNSFNSIVFHEETIGRSKDWRLRQIKIILDSLEPTDIFIVSELTRLAGSTLQVLMIMNLILEKGSSLHIVNENIILTKESNLFALAIEVEKYFIGYRLKKSIHSRKEQGRSIGRPVGSKSESLKLDKKRDELMRLLEVKVPKTKICEQLDVDMKTLRKYLKLRNIKG